jgi:hypoxanthine phosphoribosyltransferase
MGLWPYRILSRDDDDIKADLSGIMQYFMQKRQNFDMIVFVPNAGRYLSQLFVEIFDSSFEINFVTVRRASTVSKDNYLKQIIFKKKWLADAMRHIDVLLRLIRYKLGIRQAMVAELTVNFDVKNKSVLVIDDDIASGATLELVKSVLLKHDASSVTTASISNHFLPDEIKVDYSLYRYALLRTKNSRDYYAT